MELEKQLAFYMIVGLIKPDGGKISLDDSEITTYQCIEEHRKE